MCDCNCSKPLTVNINVSSPGMDEDTLAQIASSSIRHALR